MTNIIIRSAHYAVVLLMVLCASRAWAQADEAGVRAFLQQRDQDIKAAIARLDSDPDQEAYVRTLVNEKIDFQEMGRRALGEYDAGLTPEQRARYVDTFGAIVRAQSLSDLTVYNAKVIFGDIVVNGNTAHVQTRAEIDGKQVPVEYRLQHKSDGWWLYDIILDGVGTIEGYAVSFQSVIRKRGFDRLMTSLEKKRARLEPAAGT